MNSINLLDTSWMVMATALVMLMIPGLALFYAGLVKDKNVVATIMHVFMKLCFITIAWFVIGYSLSFGESQLGGFIGGLNFLFFRDVGLEAYPGTEIPHLVFATYQAMFAVITVAIITGSFAERTRLWPVLIFGMLWVLVVYAPIAHWVWGGGWLSQKFKILDFAGGAVVHLSSAIAGLVAAIYVGKRNNLKHDNVEPPHNIILTFIGASLLWFGWFGFNAGSALAANEIAVIAFINTNLAGAAGGMIWFLIELVIRKKPTLLGVISGAVSGLAAVTPAAGFIAPIYAIVIGILAGMLCYYGVSHLKPNLGYDDSLDAFGIHGIAGLIGIICSGFFASIAINPLGANGLIYGDYNTLINQIVLIIIVTIYSAIVTLILLKIINYLLPIRVSEVEEFEGLDTHQHGEKGYNINLGK